MRWVLLLISIFGLFVGGIFVHEFTHWVQNWDEEDKSICFFGEGYLAYLNTPHRVDYVQSGRANTDEIEATLIGFFAMLMGGIYLINNWRAFDNGNM